MKNIHSILAVLLFTAIVFLSKQANAQAPQKMNYQSVIRNSSNALVPNTQVGLQISVLQGSASGTAVYVERQAATTNANGLVSLQIGTGTATTGTFSVIDWAAGPYFIQTEIDPTGGSNYTITGALEILSVPYALYAAKSGGNVFEPTIDIPDDIYNTNTGNVGIGTDLPAEKLDVNGNVRVRGNVGIGTQEPNPSAALEIKSNTGALLIPRMTTAERNNLNASEGMIIYNTTDTSYQGFSNTYIYADPVVDQAQSDIDNGFGPNDKSQSFTAGISGALSSVKVLLNCLEGPKTATIYIRDGAGNSGAILYQSIVMINYNDGGNWVTIQPSGVTVIAGNVYSINIVNQGGFGPFSRIDWLCRIDQDNYSGGNLFFGADAFGGDGVFETTVTPPPSASLQWIRLNPAQTNVSSISTTMGFIGGSSTIKGGSIDENGVLSLAPADAVNGGIVTTGNQNFAGNKSFNGYVGIGTNNPAALLNVVGGDRQTGVRVEGGNASIALASSREYQIYARSEGDLVFYDQTADEAGDPSAFRMMINSAGKVGVNNANPTEQLDVAGNIKSSANMLANSFVKAGGTSSQFLMADGSVSEGILEVILTMQAQIAALQAQVAGLQSANPLDVTIGNQIWQRANLDVTTYSDGTPIPQVTDQEAWAGLTTGAWCYYNNDPGMGAIYGKLYNSYAVAGIHDDDPNTPNKVLAPSGWHVASNDEWGTLINFLGGNPGGKMKGTGTSLWSSPNTDATNSSGFIALPGGHRISVNGVFSLVGDNGYWWVASEGGVAGTSFYNLSSDSGIVNYYGGSSKYGFSVRCVRD